MRTFVKTVIQLTCLVVLWQLISTVSFSWSSDRSNDTTNSNNNNKMPQPIPAKTFWNKIMKHNYVTAIIKDPNPDVDVKTVADTAKKVTNIRVIGVNVNDQKGNNAPHDQVLDDFRTKTDIQQTEGNDFNDDKTRHHYLSDIHNYCAGHARHGPSYLAGRPNVHKSFRLRMVHIFTRTGHHAPSRLLRGCSNFNDLNCQFRTWYTGTDIKLKAFSNHMDMFQKKQPRGSKFVNWALFPDKEKCSFSDLTSVGAAQHIINGQLFSMLYINKTQLFDPSLPISNQIKVVSTTVSRAYQSTVAFLYGLLPFFNVSQIQIEASETPFFRPADKAKQLFCMNAKDFLTASDNKVMKELRQPPIMQQIASNLDDTGSTRMSMNVLRSSSVAECMLAMRCEYNSSVYQGVFIHDDTHLNYSTWQNLVEVWKLVKKIRMTDENNNYIKYVTLSLYHVMLEIARRLRDVSEKRLTPAFVLYSGHDVTLSSLLTVLGISYDHISPMASHLSIELYEHLSQNVVKARRKHYLKFLFNGNDVTSQVSFCKCSLYKGLCRLRQFTRYIMNDIINRLGHLPCHRDGVKHP